MSAAGSRRPGAVGVSARRALRLRLRGVSAGGGGSGACPGRGRKRSGLVLRGWGGGADAGAGLRSTRDGGLGESGRREPALEAEPSCPRRAAPAGLGAMKPAAAGRALLGCLCLALYLSGARGLPRR